MHCDDIAVVFGASIRQLCVEFHQFLPASSRHLHLLLFQVDYLLYSVAEAGMLQRVVCTL